MRIAPNRIDLRSMFATPLGTYKMPEDKHEEFKVAVRESIKKSDVRINDAAPSLKHYYQKSAEHLLYDNDEPIFKYFHRWLEECYCDFVIDVQGYNSSQDVFVTDCWVNVAAEGGHQVMHAHANSLVSGTYYVHMEGQCGDVVFCNPSNSANKPYLQHMTLKDSPFSSGQEIGNATEGHLILWPGNLNHYTLPTGANSARVSVSMNFMPQVLTYGGYNYRLTKDE